MSAYGDGGSSNEKKEIITMCHNVIMLRVYFHSLAIHTVRG